jgi:hypothetical protein
MPLQSLAFPSRTNSVTYRLKVGTGPVDYGPQWLLAGLPGSITVHGPDSSS